MKKNLKMFITSGVLFATMPLMAYGYRWTDPDTGYTWMYRIIYGDTAEIINWESDVAPAISPSPIGSLTIPSTLRGKLVTSIGTSAFRDCSGLTSVTIPDGVIYVGGWAFSGCSGLTNVTISGSVTSIGQSAFSGCDGLTSVTIPSSVTSVTAGAFYGCNGLNAFTVSNENPVYKSVSGLLLTKNGQTLIAGVNGEVVIPDSVTRIAAEAFWGLNDLMSVTIPGSVTNIGGLAFSDCGRLNSFIVADVNPFYKSVSGLLLTKDGMTLVAGGNGDIVVPVGVTRIGPSAFRGCSGLTSVTIPDSVTNIDDYAFDGCSRLSAFVVDSGNSVFSSLNGLLLSKDGKTLISGINGDVTIPDNITRIGKHAFYDRSGLTSVMIPSSVTNIGYDAFSGCYQLSETSVAISDLAAWSVNEINDNLPGDRRLFMDGVEIKALVIPDDVTTIGESAFASCIGLESVTIPNSITNIGNHAFADCRGLTSVTIGNGVKFINNNAFHGCCSLTSVTIPDSVTSIEACAFSNCSGLTNLTIGNSVTNIGAYAFSGCNELTSVTIPDSVKGIGDYAFSYCSGLTNVVIPNGVVWIGSYAFCNCIGLTSVSIPASVTSIGDHLFSGCNNLCRIDVTYTDDCWYDILQYDYAFLGCPSYVDIHKYDSNGEITNTWSSIEVNDTVYRTGSYTPICDSWGNLISVLNHWCDWGGTPYFTMTTNEEIYRHVFCSGYTDQLANCFSLCSASGEKLRFGVDWYLVALDDTWTEYVGSSMGGVPAGCYRFAIIGIGDYAGTYYFNVNIDKANYEGSAWCNIRFNEEYVTYNSTSVYGTYRASNTLVVSTYMYDNSPAPEILSINGCSPDGNNSCQYTISYATASDGGSSEDNMYTTTITFKDAGSYGVCFRVPSYYYEDDYTHYSFEEYNAWIEVVIQPLPIEEAGIGLADSSKSAIYTGEEIRPSLEWEASAQTMFYYEDIGAITNAGTYNIVVGTEMDMTDERVWYQYCPAIYDENGNYVGNCSAANYTGVTSVVFTVLPRPVVTEQARVVPCELHCDGTPQTCSVVITNDYNGAVLVEGRDYDVAYANNILAGTATATVTCKGNYSGTFSQSFEILPSTNVVEVLGLDKKWTTGGNAEWFAEWFEAAHDGVSCMRSGAIGDNQESWIETVVTNTGVVSFWWKASSEAYRGIAYDKAVFSVDGVDVASIGGEVDWTNVTYAVEGNGPHVLRWTYYKDASDYGGQDCAWLDEVQYLREVRVAFADGGATEGSVPASETIGEGLQITLPDQGSLAWPKHRFSGWSTGDEIIAPGTLYALGYDELTFTAVWEEKRVSAPTIEVAAWYDTERTAVTMGCETAGATIHYTLDGSTPTSASPVYAGSFYLAGSATIRAIAVLDDFFDSDVVAAESVRAPWTPDECLNAPGLAFNMGGDAIWIRDRTMTHDGDTAMRSGEIGDNQTSWVEASVSGAGTLTFWWKVSSEAYKGTIYDYARFTVDGVAVVSDIGGEINWRSESVTITDGGTHTFRWAYVKDAQNTNGSDCAWLDEVTWVPVESPNPIPLVASDSEVAAALAGTTDASITANVTNAAQYVAYRSWALSVTNATTTAQMIKESTRTWLSYAFGADALIAKELTSDDVKIESFTPASTDGQFEFTVSVKDVNIGGGSVEVETLKENLKKVLGIEGAATLSPGGFSSDNIDIAFDAPVDGKARFTVSPPADAGNSFFMRVKVK